MPRDVGVIIVAAGQGRRLGGLPKQYRPVAGVPLVVRAVRPFLAHPDVAHVVLVLPPADAEAPPKFLARLAGPLLSFAPGGAERHHSVANGLAALPAVCDIVLVHDGARPFVESAVIDAVIGEARHGVGAVAGVPITDTVKEVAADDPHRIMRTVPRETLWRAQTPQGFPRAMLAAAHARARREGISASDDAALVEWAGGVVHLVPDSPYNIKVTTADDLAWAELWAGRR